MLLTFALVPIALAAKPHSVDDFYSSFSEAWSQQGPCATVQFVVPEARKRELATCDQLSHFVIEGAVSRLPSQDADELRATLQRARDDCGLHGPYMRETRYGGVHNERRCSAALGAITVQAEAYAGIVPTLVLEPEPAIKLDQGITCPLVLVDRTWYLNLEFGACKPPAYPR